MQQGSLPKSVNRPLGVQTKGFRHPADGGGYHGQQNEVGEPQTGNYSPRSHQFARHCRWLYPLPDLLANFFSGIVLVRAKDDGSA